MVGFKRVRISTCFQVQIERNFLGNLGIAFTFGTDCRPPSCPALLPAQSRELWKVEKSKIIAVQLHRADHRVGNHRRGYPQQQQQRQEEEEEETLRGQHGRRRGRLPAEQGHVYLS